MNWIPVTFKLPPHGVNVLATYKNSYGKQRFIVGHYLERWKEESNQDDDAPEEYSEELDNYFYKEGWYEQQDNWDNYGSIAVHQGKVSHWMPLPDAPETVVSKEVDA